MFFLYGGDEGVNYPNETYNWYLHEKMYWIRICMHVDYVDLPVNYPRAYK
jgi:hypothetical protein